MTMSGRPNGGFEIQTCPIIGPYNVQRFKQWCPEDTANWYIVKSENTKEQFAMYPTLGRAHIRFSGINRLIYTHESRGIFKSINFTYIVVGNIIHRIDSNYNEVILTGLQTTSGPIYFTFLVVNTTVFSCFVDSQKIYVYQEGVGGLQVVTDPNAPGNFSVDGQLTKPGYIATFGNRIVVSVDESSQFVLSKINLGGIPFNPLTCWTNPDTPQVFAQEEGIIRQLGVLNNTLYIFTDYTTGVWSNITSVFAPTGTTFPWKKNTTYNWNFGIAQPDSLDIDFGMMVFLARNSDGLLQFMASDGGQPRRISTKAIDTLLQKYTNSFGNNNPFLLSNANGFLYQYENTMFYRISGGPYNDDGILDQRLRGDCIEYSFEANEWHRVIELNGERNRVRFHTYFNNKHLVSVIDDNTIYDMSGQYYYNEITNPDQPNRQAVDAYLAYPFRYERITPIIYDKAYAEFETEYLQIDFVWGDSNIVYSTAPFQNAQYLVSEDSTVDNPIYIVAENSDSGGQPIFIIYDIGNTPGLNDLTYNYLFKPHVELYWSDDGGISFNSADVLEFSQMGVYSWRMRWYQLGTSRNRVYKLIAVSPVPIVVLGAVMMVRRVSDGSN